MACSDLNILNRVGPWSRLCALGLLVIGFSFSANPIPLAISAAVLFGAGSIVEFQTDDSLVFIRDCPVRCVHSGCRFNCRADESNGQFASSKFKF